MHGIGIVALDAGDKSHGSALAALAFCSDWSDWPDRSSFAVLTVLTGLTFFALRPRLAAIAPLTARPCDALALAPRRALRPLLALQSDLALPSNRTDRPTLALYAIAAIAACRPSRTDRQLKRCHAARDLLDHAHMQRARNDLGVSILAIAAGGADRPGLTLQAHLALPSDRAHGPALACRTRRPTLSVAAGRALRARFTALALRTDGLDADFLGDDIAGRTDRPGLALQSALSALARITFWSGWPGFALQSDFALAADGTDCTAFTALALWSGSAGRSGLAVSAGSASFAVLARWTHFAGGTLLAFRTECA
jgi:hypothetical protein